MIVKVKYWMKKVKNLKDDEIEVEAYYCPFCRKIILNDPEGLNAFPNCLHYVDFSDNNEIILSSEESGERRIKF